ncbi:MAG TPA: DMT family transporter [Actinomycetota bacterium]|nr:DMT family transporter [Actinomycetota bacterium]
MAVLLGLLSGIVYGAADFCGGLSTKRNPMVRVVLLSQLAGFVVYLVAVPLLPEGRFTAGAWAWGGLSGLAGAVGIGFLYAGLARGRMSVVAPTAAVVFAVVPLAFGLLRGERPTALQLVGVAVALPAVALVSTARDPDAFLGSGRSATLARMRSTGVPEAVAAGLAIAAFAILLDETGDETGPWPLVSGRIVSVGIFLAAVLVSRTPLRPTTGTAGIIVAAGVFDVSANLLYLLAIREGLLSIVVVLTGLYPATTVILARALLRERLSRSQVVGLVLALGGVAAIAAG